jgi:hypothetical protein
MQHSLTALTLVSAMAMSSSVLAQSSTSGPTPLFDEPRFVAKTMSWIEDFGRDDSSERNDGVLVDVSAAISWRGYKTAQGLLECPHLVKDRLTIGPRLQWQDFTQIRYFGLGPGTREAGVSDYRMKTTNVVGGMVVRGGWSTYRDQSTGTFTFTFDRAHESLRLARMATRTAAIPFVP